MLKGIQWRTNTHGPYCEGAYNLADKTEKKTSIPTNWAGLLCDRAFWQWVVVDREHNTALTRWSGMACLRRWTFHWAPEGWEGDSQGESVPAEGIRLYKIQLGCLKDRIISSVGLIWWLIVSTWLCHKVPRLNIISGCVIKDVSGRDEHLNQ